MNIYLLQQEVNDDYDTYDSVVVVAKNEREARLIHPNPFVKHVSNGVWMGVNISGEEYETGKYDWVKYSQIDLIKVTLIGKAVKDQKAGVVLASFNAG